MTDFSGVAPALAAALTAREFTALTPVQTAMLDPALDGEDLLVSAQTGSGKTVAFGLSIATELLGDAEEFETADAPQALVIAPTRELALQVQRELGWLYSKTGVRVIACVGGMDARDERRALSRGADIVVGTPGRLVDHINRGALDLAYVSAIVLDEADEMLDLGFREELEHILSASPEDRRTLMFSATVPKSILRLTERYQKDAVRVTTEAEASQHLDIDYEAMTVPGPQRDHAIINTLRYHNPRNALVFCATRAAVNLLTAKLRNRGFAVEALSGEFSQKERSHALQAMRDGRAQVCVATDVAARGIDLPELELVIHADLPKDKPGLLHRSGRTGRAGRRGTSILITAGRARKRVERLLKDAGIEARWTEAPTADAIRQKDDERLLADTTLAEPVQESETELVGRLLEAYSAEQVAAAFIRQHRSGQSAPEDITHEPYEPAPAARKPKGRREREQAKSQDKFQDRKGSRNDFENGVWITLTVGRKQTADPKWLLPMLCKSGGLNRQQIGAIRIDRTVSHVELHPDAVDRFFNHISDDGRVESTIIAFRAEGEPQISEADDRDARDPRPRRRPRPDREDGAPWKSKKRSDRPSNKQSDDRGKKRGPKRSNPNKGKPKRRAPRD